MLLHHEMNNHKYQVIPLLINLCSIRSFGESYLGGTFNLANLSDWKDQLVRVPAKLFRTRPAEYGAQDRKRMR